MSGAGRECVTMDSVVPSSAGAQEPATFQSLRRRQGCRSKIFNGTLRSVDFGHSSPRELTLMADPLQWVSVPMEEHADDLAGLQIPATERL